MKEAMNQTSASGRPGLQLLRALQRVFQDDVQAAPDWETPTQPADADTGPEGRCVLVVDDNPVNLMLACELLSSFGVQPMMAADGAEAVDLACSVRLDIILMDLQMPVLDGLTATRQIRQFEREHRRDRVPVVAYTSSAPALHVLQSWGIDDVLDKPCNRHALQGSLQRWCPHLLPAAAPFRAPAGRLTHGFSAPGGPLG